MKFACSVLTTIFLSFFTSAQAVITNDFDYKAFEVKNYILKHIKEFTSIYSDTVELEVEVHVDGDSKMVESVEMAIYNAGDRVNIDSIPLHVSNYIRTVYMFNPSVDEEDEVLFSTTMFKFPLNAKLLKEEQKGLKVALDDRVKFMVRPNAKFKLVIDELLCKPFVGSDRVDTLKNIVFKSKLRGLKSDVFQLNDQYFVVFTVKNISEDHKYACEVKLSPYFVHDEVADLMMSSLALDPHSLTYHFEDKAKWSVTPESDEVGFFEIKARIFFK